MRARQTRRARLGSTIVALFATAVVVAGCGGDGDDADDGEPEGAAPTAELIQPTETPLTGDSPETDASDVVVLTDDDEHRVTEAGQASVQCDGGGEVYIQTGASVTITGRCDEVDIDGDGATVMVEFSEDVDIDGSENNLSADEIGDLDVSGNGNVVDVATVREIDVEGDGNTVAYGGSPEIDDEGDGNTIEPR